MFLLWPNNVVVLDLQGLRTEIKIDSEWFEGHFRAARKPELLPFEKRRQPNPQ